MISFAACDVVIGIEPLPLSTPYLEPACETCIDAQCAAEERSCFADEDCRTLHHCLAACPVDAPLCRRDCEQVVPDLTQ